MTPLDALSESVLAELVHISRTCLDEQQNELLIDLGRVQSVTSLALETFLEIQELVAARGGRLRVSNANPLIREILHITGVEYRISVAHADGDGPRESSGRKRLGDILIARDLLTEEQLGQALQLQKQSSQRLGEIFIEKGWVSEQDVLRALSAQLSIPDVKLRPGIFDPATSNLIDGRDIKRLKVFPMFRIHDELTLATTNPQNVPCLREVENLTRCSVRPVLARQEDIFAVADESGPDLDLGTDFISEVDEDFEVVEGIRPQDLDAVDEAASGSPVINLVNSLIQRAVREGASDVHIEPFRDKSRVRYRIDGVLYEVMTLRAELHPALISRLKVMANLDISERRMPQDGRVQVMTQGRAVDLRFSSLPGLHGEKVVLRILDKNRAILELGKLGMSERNVASYRDLLGCGYGLVLVTGPTGSGKTTSLYAALNHLKSLEKNIVTIEDPVEYQLDIINQNEVRANIGLTFAKILKHVLRQDPDIIMVGEIRERETAEIAVQSALTGHLVLSTLHTNDSIGAVTRMIDMGVAPYLLSSALIGVVAQRLVRTICAACKTTYLAPPELVSQFGWDPEQKHRLARGRGCSECYDSGYKGRIAIHETLPITGDLQNLIISNPSRDELSDYLRAKDVELLFDDGLQRVRGQLTTPEEVARVINS
ncbi:MAG: ATPase, T2SS/T4P/T4SS family [Gammaproteobacteria bacterium]|nr:ATPase, T2SS/T4P/T4SS family [Gammaproteobacteria bacterium]